MSALATIAPATVNLDAFDYSQPVPLYAPHTGADAERAVGELRGIVEHAIVHQPRSLQKRIGPSEVGNPCDHCLTAQLAGWDKTPEGTPWLTTIGTAVHGWLEEQVLEHENARNAVHTTGRRWLTEREVTVGQIGGVDVTGHSDLFDVETGTVIDHKIVGPTTLRSAPRGPKGAYRPQAHLYGRGFAAAGFTVTAVAILYWARNGGWSDAVLWTEPYDEQVALEALARANQLHTNLTALASISTEARDAWITSLPRAKGCWDCARYPDQRPADDATLGGLLTPARVGGSTK